MAVVKGVLFTLSVAVLAAASALEPLVLGEAQLTNNPAPEAEAVNDAGAARFNPDLQNVLHLFTRQNPALSQPMLLGTDMQLRASNYDGRRRTVIIIHGWTQSGTSDVNTVLVPAFLAAADVNVFVYDWSFGASVIQGNNGPDNAIASGRSLARAIDWLCRSTGASTDHFHLVGFSLGAHLAGVAGRNVQVGRIAYITALDPGANMEDSGHIFSPNAATYTEAIHTNSDIMGHGAPVAHVDFFPNGGDYQPGCGLNFLCNHYRAFHFFAETLGSNNNWMGTRCQTLIQARTGLCVGLFGVRMGGLSPKAGSEGLFHLRTNAAPPFQPVRD